MNILPKFRVLGSSLLLRLGSAIAAITMLTVVGMASSAIVAESTQGSGKAINLAGSLRMLSYQMASIALVENRPTQSDGKTEMEKLVTHFDVTLRDPHITGQLPRDAETELATRYRTVVAKWNQRIKPDFEAVAHGGAESKRVLADRAALLNEVHGFVDQIDRLVKQLAQGTEDKILVLRMVLGAALILTALVVILTLYFAYTDLVLPLRQLLTLAASVGRGDLSARTHHTGPDELGRLGQAFNAMAEDLSRHYQNLEARVAEKTAELTVANRSLELLYHSIARLYNGPVAPDTYSILLKDLENVLGVGHGQACLVEAGDACARVIASTLDPARGDMDLCGLMSCADCLANKGLAIHALQGGSRVLSLPLQDMRQNYGVLQFEMPEGRELEIWQSQLLEALSRHIGIAIGTARRSEQSRRVSLLEERAALARELHDSLAQSLAYMKIQVSRLKPLVEQPRNGNGAPQVLGELREGLNSAYRQLRELLTTFRLRIEGEGLAAALQTTVAEFSGRGGLPITLEIHLAGCPLSANEEIHTLQIVREALSNVVNHAKAMRARVKVDCGGDGSVSAIIEDDGIGIKKIAGAHHYGMTIMEERAKNLGGTLIIENPATLGTRVTLHFTPTRERETAISIQPGLAT
jgi:two-component system, NarL family, nitrate/nitrite sensor histidine kinase NarX